MSDTISRQAAIDALKDAENHAFNSYHQGLIKAHKIIADLPPAQPEIKPIGYSDCANAMLKMWMDNVVTDGEYNRIMDKLNAHWGMKNG